MFRRPMRPMRPFRRAFVPDIPPLLQRANELMSIGDYDGAAAAFEQLARGALARNGPRAPMLFLQAGRARILAGQVQPGTQHLKQGLSLLAARGQWPQFHKAGERAVQELNERGLSAEAQEISDYLKTTLPTGFVAPTATAAAKKPLLPTHCPGCGAPLRADEVEWLDEATAQCAFCGSPVRGA